MEDELSSVPSKSKKELIFPHDGRKKFDYIVTELESKLIEKSKSDPNLQQMISFLQTYLIRSQMAAERISIDEKSTFLCVSPEWRAQLVQKTIRWIVIFTLMRVSELYENILLRSADLSGLKHQAERILISGDNTTMIARSMIASEEHGRSILFDAWKRVPSPGHRKVCERRIVSDEFSGKKVWFIGPIGTSGYAIASKALLLSLYMKGVRLKFSVNDFYNVSLDKMDEESMLQLALYKDPMFVDLENTDVVVIHASMDKWPQWIEEARRQCPRAKVYGISVWETDHFPPFWVDIARGVDVVSVPCQWNKEALEADFSADPSLARPRVDVVHHVVQLNSLPNPAFRLIVDEREKEDGLFWFYTINEFNGRKGLPDLVDAFLAEFSSADRVALYIKASGDVRGPQGRAWLESKLNEWAEARKIDGEDEEATLLSPPKIVLDYRILSDEEIAAVHTRCNCFVSLTRAEGQGIGACAALLMKRRVIITGHGGQMDYLGPFEGNGVDFVEVESMVPANFCSRMHEGWESCEARGFCARNEIYDGRTMKWAKPSVKHARELLRKVVTETTDPWSPAPTFKDKDGRSIGDLFSLESVGQNLIDSITFV